MFPSTQRFAMKLHFRSWENPGSEHTLDITPASYVGDDNYLECGKLGDPLSWYDDKHVLGKIDEIELEGSYLVRFELSRQELKSWLQRLAASAPEDAIRLTAEIQAEAIIELARQTKYGAMNHVDIHSDEELP